MRPGAEDSDDHPLEHVVATTLPQVLLRTTVVVTFDASLWGGGAVLYENSVPTGYCEVGWTEFDLTPWA